MTDRKSFPGVRLRPVAESDYEMLERWCAQSDVFQFLEYPEPPNRYEIKKAVLAKNVEILIIDLDDGTPVGFFLLYFRGLVRHRSREFDIAIPEIHRRQSGLAQAAILEFERWAFEVEKYSKLWAVIFADNAPCIALVHACHWPLSPVQEKAINYRGRPRDVVMTHMTPELLIETRKRRGF
ncbi:MAG: GNAT family N-acetyltransferase [Deltaproteobacteria bacterium]|nr:GNAT family N-acetyltransferase [Deltaproteobacteria bacterium]